MEAMTSRIEPEPARPIVDVDERECHPGLVFFQDRTTRFTVALERETGALVGSSGESLPAGHPLWDELDEYQAAHSPRSDEEGGREYDHYHACVVCGRLAGCFAPCGTARGYVCGGCEPEIEPDIGY